MVSKLVSLTNTEGNNLRKNDVLYYIMSGKGTFTSSGHHSVKLKKATYSTFHVVKPATFKQIMMNHGSISGLG